MPDVNFDIYLITDRNQCGSDGLLTCVENALKAGVGAVQLREKDLLTDERYKLGVKLRDVTYSYYAKLFVNGDAALARAIEADGVHLPQDGLPVDVCRTVLQPGMLIGVSTHSIEEAREAESKGADFVTFGPVYYTPSKAQYGKPVGLDALRAVCAAVGLPVFALGGVKPDTIEEVVSAGAAGISMISAILAAHDAEAAAADLAHRLDQARSNKSFQKKEG